MALVKFKDLDNALLKELVASDKKLRERFDTHIQESEMDYLNEKLDCVTSSLGNWSYGFYNRNYMKVEDYDKFVDGVMESIRCFGGSINLTKLVEHCDRLRGTNLFDYWAKQVKEVYEKEELQSICDYVEGASNELYCKEIGEHCESYFEEFTWLIDDYLYDEENKTYYTPHKVA